MNYTKQQNKDFVFKLIFKLLLDILAERKTNKEVLKIIKFLEKK